MIRSPDVPANLETPMLVNDSFDVHLKINAVLTPYALTKHLSVPVHINKAEKSHLALVDSGAMGNFIHENLVTELNLTRMPRRTLPLMDVKGLKIGLLEFQVKLTMRIGSHEEHLVLDMAPIGSHRLILGLPWLEAHDPTIQWSTGHFQFNSPHCNLHCLPQPHDVFARSPVIATANVDVKIPVMRNTPDAQLPTCSSPDSAGWDLYSTENTTIPVGQHALIDTGVTLQLPPRTYG